MSKIIRSWKVIGKGGSNNDINSREYFLKNNCISCGWGLENYDIENQVSSLGEYKKLWLESIRDKKWGNQGIHLLFDEVKKDDYIWLKVNGLYYVAHVTDTPEKLFRYEKTQEAMGNDCVAQLFPMKWVLVGGEDCIPGSITIRYRKAINRVDNNDFIYTYEDGLKYTSTSLFSKHLIENRAKKIFTNQRELFNLLGPIGLEDLVAIWLYYKFNYIVIPSTSKLSTEHYEFVMVDGKKNKANEYSSTKRIYIQVKNSSSTINVKDYVNLLQENGDEVWLVSAAGKVVGSLNDDSKGQIARYAMIDNSFVETRFDINELLFFAFDSKNSNILPKSTKFWLKYFM